MDQHRLSPEQIMEQLRRLRARRVDDRDRLSMLHEISVYQEELLAQNDALIRARTALEDTRDRFIELYDFAPNGYLTLDAQGVIRQCNLTAAALIGQSKVALEGTPLLGFVKSDDRPRYLEFLRRCRTVGQADLEAELTPRTGNGPRCVQMLCRERVGAGAAPEYLTSVIDVTERKMLEREREGMAREQAALAGRVISVQDAERTRIARNLHDDIGQELTALRLMLELLVNETSPAAMAAGVARAQVTLDSLDHRLHFVASDLRPAALDLGVVVALEHFVRQWSATFGVPVTFHGSGVPAGALTPEVETHIYRIAQEALNNISKHAAASKVTVGIEGHGDRVELTVQDDGRGFDPERRPHDGLGLAGMRERAQLIAGRLDVESGARGTSVVLRLPVVLFQPR
jgi:PAS domain S-box-containing protein